jgi:hypothetical protein
MALNDQQAFDTWFDFHTKGDTKFAEGENENMEEILNFFSQPNTNALNFYSVTLRDEYGIILAIDKHLTNLIMLHKVEALPATRHNKNAMVRALHGFGKEAIPVLLDPSILEVTTTVDCPSVTTIRKAVREGVTDITKLTRTSTYKGMSLIMLPPFIAKALLNLPNLSVDKVLAATLEAIAKYEKDNKPSSPIAAAAKPAATRLAAARPADLDMTLETVDSDEDSEDYAGASEGNDKPPAPTASTTPTSDNKEKEAATKKAPAIPSTYTRCAQLIKFLMIAQYQQYHYEDLEEEILNGTIVRPTLDMEHRQWAAIHHVQCEVGQPPKDASSTTSPNDPQYLFDRVAHPLNEIKASIDNFMEKYDTPAAATEKNPLKKLEDKFELSQIVQFKRLSSTDGISPMEELQTFLVKFLTAKGTGGTGAAQLLALNNRINRRNISIPIGCITAMHSGRFGWDHPTVPNNFSVFYTPRANVLDMGKAASAELLNVHLRAEVGKGIENGDINKITKQYMTVPGTVPDMVKQLDNHNKLQGDFWGEDSMVYKECQRFIRGIDEYEASYESAHVADPMFLCKVMYYYDLTLYHLYDECLVKKEFMEIRWELADLQKCHTKVLQGQFFQSLPVCLQSPPSKKREIERISDGRKPEGFPKAQNPNGPHLPNKDQHSILQLQTGENFNDVVLRTQQMKLVPDLPGTKTRVCLNWHINGRCHDNCERKSSHKILADGTLKKMEGFMKACRVAHKKVIDNKDKN